MRAPFMHREDTLTLIPLAVINESSIPGPSAAPARRGEPGEGPGTPSLWSGKITGTGATRLF